MQSDRTAYIREVLLNRTEVPSFDAYPFCLPPVGQLDCLPLHPAVTFLVGENGTGKSTLLEAIAVAYGFNAEGGSRNFSFSTRESHSELAKYITLVKGTESPKDGYFLRAESFFTVATEIERLDSGGGGGRVIDAYGGKSLHEQSHGESFLSLLLHRFRGHGLYILDEPEAALSPQRQLALLRRIHHLVQDGSQFVIATHSPIVLAYPDAKIVSLSADGMSDTGYEDTDHYQLTLTFLQNPTRMLAAILED